MRKIAISLAALALVATAQAQTSRPSGNTNAAGTYGLLSLGQSHLNTDCTGPNACDRNALGGKAVFGYAFGDGLSLEGGYTSFGKFRASRGPLGLSARPDALHFGGAYSANLTPDWGVVGRVGVARVRTRLDADAGTLGGASDSESKTQPIVGVGVNYALNPSTRVELGVDTTRAHYLGERHNVRMVSLGARMAF